MSVASSVTDHVALSASSQQPHLKVSLFLGSGSPVRFRQHIPLGLPQISTTSAAVFLKWALKILNDRVTVRQVEETEEQLFQSS